MEWMHFLRWAHIIGATVLLGTGAGIAFFMVMAHRTRDARLIAHTASIVVIADWLFTASAVVIQPLSGIALAHLAGWPLTAPWLLASYGLYGFIGACWLPVVWIQYRVRDRLVAEEGEAAPPEVHRLMRIWFVLGWPAFAALIGIFVLMITKPGF